MARWLKLNTEEAKGFNFTITEAITEALPHLQLEVGRDIRDYLVWSIIGDFTYVRTGLFDLKNHCRINFASKAEVEMWDDAIAKNNWQVVYDIPQTEIAI